MGAGQGDDGLVDAVLGELDAHALAERAVAALMPGWAGAAAIYWDEQEPDEVFDRELDAPRLRRIASAHAAGAPWADPATETHLVEAAERALHEGQARTIAVAGLQGCAWPLAERGALVLLSADADTPWRTRGDAAAERIGRGLVAALRHGAVARALEQRDQVIAMLAHDLRNSLGTASMNCQLLATRSLGEASPPQARRQVEAVQRAVDWMSELVDDLLELRAFAGEDRVPEPVALDPVALAQEAALRLEPATHGRELRILVEDQAAGARLLGERTGVLQVLDQLLGNALAASPAGGVVTVRVAARDGRVAFAVIDAGPGLALGEHGAAALFRGTFKQGEGPGGKRRSMGLPIAHFLVRAMNGRIWVDSQPGAGSTFHVTLPEATAT
jgi:signal transduction histidine kinase